MKQASRVYLTDTHIISPLGVGSKHNFSKLLHGESGIRMIDDLRFFREALPLAKIEDAYINAIIKQQHVYTRFDALLLQCAHEIQLSSSIDLSSPDTIIFLSTTKGNIELMKENAEDERLSLSYSAKLLQEVCNNPNQPYIVSNACISGLSAIISASRLLQAGIYKYALVIGCDVLSEFVISGFTSFHAISKQICRPFDKNRDGINLGEASAACILSTEVKSNMLIGKGCIANDANHISGPSKTGEELAYCIQQIMNEHQLTPSQIDFVSAHGTATEYNDEMESKALSISGLHTSPVFSLKPNYGHTLGAAGILETIITAECLQQGIILPSLGYQEKGVSGDIIVSEIVKEKAMSYALKTASGFGGCDAALLIEKLG